MADVIENEEAQIMLLTVFIIVIGVVTYTTILNNMILSSNVPVTGIENSKQEIRDLRSLTESEVIKAAYYASTNVSDNTSKPIVRQYFFKYMNSSIKNIRKFYASKGVSVELLIDSNTSVKNYYVERKNHRFKKGSLIIPMDENQILAQDQSKLMKIYGFVYRIVDDKGTEPLNQTNIPVWTILQNPVNSSAPNFSSRIYTNDNASNLSNGITQYRYYSGGPFIIDNDSASEEWHFNEARKTLILEEAKRMNITVHELVEDFYCEKCAQMVVPPRVAVYPQYPGDVMEKYYLDGEVPYTGLSDIDIQNGDLTDYDILTITDQTMDTPSSRENTVIAIADWVANGGVLHAQGEGTDTMDDAVEIYAGDRKPWYGFIGINRSELNSTKINLSMTYLKFIDNSTAFDWSPSPEGWWRFNMDSGESDALAIDSSGRKNNGTIKNTNSGIDNGSSGWTANGKFGYGLIFDGVDDYVTMGNPSNGALDFGTGDFSISAWFYMPSLPNAWKTIASKGDSGSIGYGMEISNYNKLTCSIQAAGGTNQHLFGNVPSAGSWHQAVCVFDRDDKIYMYMDGVLVTSGPYAFNNTNSVTYSRPFGIGSHDGTVWYFNGSIDEVQLFRQALSLEEINASFNRGSYRFNSTKTFNDSPPMSLAGLADPGAPFDPLAQTSNETGILGNMTEASITPAFSLRSNGSQVNPDANIIGVATYEDGTPVYIDADINPDGVKDLQIMYIEAKYGNGLVTYLAGHNQSARPGGERLIFNTFFASGMTNQSYSIIPARNINITIKYFDGNVEYSDTFPLDI